MRRGLFSTRAFVAGALVVAMAAAQRGKKVEEQTALELEDVVVRTRARL